MRLRAADRSSPPKPGMAPKSARHRAKPSPRWDDHHTPSAVVRDLRIRAPVPEVPNAASTRPRMVVAAHHRMDAQGLRAMLRRRYEVVAVVRDDAEVVKTVEALKPELLLLGLSLPCRTGFDILRALKSGTSAVRVVVVAIPLGKRLVDTAFRLGASAFVPKDADVAELRKALKEVLAGRRYRSPLLREPTHERSAQDRPGFGRLTPRQRDIVRLIGQGFHTEDIAGKLGISVHTVSFHRKNIRRELGFDGNGSLLHFAILAELSEGPRCAFDGRFACLDAGANLASAERP